MSFELQLLTATTPMRQRLAHKVSQLDPWLRLGITEAALLRLFGRLGDANVRAIVYQSEPAGLVVLQKDWLFGDYIKILAVLHSMQGRGIGGYALDAIADEARGSGGRNVWACVSAFNARALDFYLRNDFEKVGRLQDLVVPGEDEILIRRRLD